MIRPGERGAAGCGWVRRVAGPLVGVVAFAALAVACGGGASDPDASRDADVADVITVAAASDLRFAFEELAEVFTAASGIRVTFSFGSSGQLREQIVNGAPFDLFASANVAFVDAVVASGRGIAETQADYALGRIVLWTPEGIEAPDSIEDLANPRFRRIAIANPDHAPYGLAAEQALRSVGVLDEVADRLVYGENISDTLRIARSGNADVGIVALSLVVADGSAYVEVPDRLHEPLRQALVVTSTGARGRAATRFADFVGSPEGRAVMERYGFVLPAGASDRG